MLTVPNRVGTDFTAKAKPILVVDEGVGAGGAIALPRKSDEEENGHKPDCLWGFFFVFVCFL